MVKSKRYNSRVAAAEKGAATSAANSQQARIEAWGTATDYTVYWAKDGVQKYGRLSSLTMADTDEVMKVMCGGKDHRTNIRKNGDPSKFKINQEKERVLKEYLRRTEEQESTKGVTFIERVVASNRRRARSH